jgi:Fe-Mn family superoxide dismutase
MCYLNFKIWNHTFYWASMSPNGGGAPTGKLADLINATWGSFDAFKAKFTEEASNHFGSGWAWLVRDDKNNVRDRIRPSDLHC